MEDKSRPNQTEPIHPTPVQTAPIHSTPLRSKPNQTNPTQTPESDDKITSIRVRARTRDSLKVMADRKGVSMEDMVLRLMQKDMTKQILLTVDMKDYYAMTDIAKILRNMKRTNSERVDEMLVWTFRRVMLDIRKEMGIDSSIKPTTVNENYGQPQGVQTV